MARVITRQGATQPGARVGPVSLGRARRDPLDLGGFVDGQPGEHPQLDDLGSLSVLCSVASRNTLKALLSAYLILLIASPVVFLGSPVRFFLTAEEMIRVQPRPGPPFSGPVAPPSPVAVTAGLLLVYAIPHGLVTAVCVTGQLLHNVRCHRCWGTPAPAAQTRLSYIDDDCSLF